MWMPRDHLIRHCVSDIIKTKESRFLGHLGVKDGLEQEITKLTFELVPCLTLNRVGDLIGLLDGIGGDGGESLFDIPRTACFGVAQGAHDRAEAREAAIGSVNERVVSHCLCLLFGVEC